MKISNVHLITFGGGNFEYRRSARRLAIQAESSGLFKTVTKVTDKTFRSYCSIAWQQHQDFMVNSEKGFGYWLWKPIIIQQRLDEISSNDVLVYLDAGCELNLLNKEPRDRIQYYFNLARQHGSLAMQLRGMSEKGIFPTESRYSKGALISSLRPSAKTLTENQLMATMMMFQKNDTNQVFLKKWLELAVSCNYALLTDDLNQVYDDGFVGHRHDQSIFSILYKELGKFHIPDETYWKPDWNIRGSDYPIWAMRNRTGISKGVMKVPDILDRSISRLNFAKELIFQKSSRFF